MAVTRKKLVYGGVIAVLAVAIIVAAVIYIMVQKESDKEDKKENEDGHNGHEGHHGHHAKCGYEVCPAVKPNMINIHIIAHTHDDVGWLKTVDQYYYGSRSRIQQAGVQYILDSVIQELLRDPKKRFIYVESAFFFKWWMQQDTKLQAKVKELVWEGRLEFIGGAWSMNDEATVHYQSTIDQFTWGLRRLNDTFGKCATPRIGWQIDPFGHSREMASLFAQMGYDGLFFARLDYQDKNKRLNTSNMETIWQASANLDESNSLFTGAMFDFYNSPRNFCFDILCSDEPIINDKNSEDYNVDRRLTEFETYAKKQAASFRTNNIMIPMGGDFTFMAAHTHFKNIDLLIRHGNERQANGSNFNFFYSTPSCYLKSLHDANLTWSTKTDDFFPYSSDPHTFWTGYFTSRPTLKRFERMGNHFLQVCKQLSALAPAAAMTPEFEGNLAMLKEVMGIMQHHDAVTGTEKQHVADDYALLLNNAFERCEENTREVLNLLTNNDHHHHNHQRHAEFAFDNCLHLNISMCDVSESSETFMLTVYNPLAQATNEYVRIPVKANDYEVNDHRGESLPIQLVPITQDIQSLHYRTSPASFEIVFLAKEIPPMGYRSYFVTQKANSSALPAVTPVRAESVSIGNDRLNLTFNENGLLSQIAVNGLSKNISQTFHVYNGAMGNNEIFANRSSGAYIFRPNGTAIGLARADVRVVKGDWVDEIHQTFNSWISQVVRVYKNESHAEFEWMVGEIPIEDNIGREIVTRFDTDIKSNSVFYTDSNGRQMIRRQRNHRETWNVELNETVSGNYYPITARIAIEDENTRLAILNDRAQGGSSLADGSIEIMIHRRLLKDDAFGVEEALNETAFGKGLIARGVHYVTLLTKQTNEAKISHATERNIQLKKLLPSWLFFSPIPTMSFATWMDSYTHNHTSLSPPLPPNVHLLTYEPWKDGTVLIRFEHIYEQNEDPEYGGSAAFNLNEVFQSLKIKEIRETTLAGNQWLNEAKRLTFTANSTNGARHQSEYTQMQTIKSVDVSNLAITLEPMQIRTFVIAFEHQAKP